MISDRSAIIYVRVSSEKQVREGNGLESQEIRCKTYCLQQGYPVLKVFKEAGVSGKLYDRPQYMAMLKYIDEIKQPLVVVADNLDRLTRDVEAGARILKDMEKRQAELKGPNWEYTDSPEGNVHYNIQIAVAQYMRESNARQVRNRTSARMQSGYRTIGGCVIGYEPTEVAGIHRPYEPVASVIKDVLEGYADGRFTNYSEMSRYIANQKLPQRERKKNKPDSLKTKRHFITPNGDKVKTQILENAPYYAGFIENEKLDIKRIKGQHASIISLETLDRIEKRLKGERLPIYRKNLNKYFPLRGHLRCANCNKPMMGSYCGGRNREYGYYYCQQSSCELKNINIRYETIHQQFESLLATLQPNGLLSDKVKQVFTDIWKQEKADKMTLSQDLKAEIARLEAKIQLHLDEILETTVPSIKKHLSDRLTNLEKQKIAFESRLETNQLKDGDFEKALDSVINILSCPLDLWEQADLEEKQLIQTIIFPNGLIYDQIDKNFRKPEKALVFTATRKLKAEKNLLVGPEGLEPPTKPL